MDIRKIYEYALQREHEGKRFFEQSAERLGHAAAVGAFQRLAAEEQKHIEFIQELLDALDKGESPAAVGDIELEKEGFFSERATSELLDQTGRHRGIGDKTQARTRQCLTETAEHRAEMYRLWRRYRGICIAHRRMNDHATFDDKAWFGAEESRFPQNQVGQLAGFDRTHFMRDTVSNGRIDGVLGDIAFDPQIVVVGGITCETAALDFHFVRRLPGAGNHLTYAAHGLGVRSDHGEGAEIVQDILGRYGFASDAGLGEGDIFGDIGIEMMTDHQHVEMFVHRVDRIGASGICG